MIEKIQRTIKEEFPLANRSLDGLPITYLDSAATSLKPRQVIQAVVDYYSEVSANIHRGKHLLSEIASVHFEQTRSNVAGFIGCAAPEVIFTQNTTQSLNIVAFGLDLKKEDLVIIQGDSHHSALLPWRRYATVKHVRILPSGVVDLDHFRELLGEHPKVVVLTHCSNITGIYAFVDAMARMAKEIGAFVVVDAAQSVPHRRIRFHASDVDFLAFSGHKMLGPTGIGILCGRAELLRNLRPLNYGGGMVDWVEYDSEHLRKLPHMLEAGTPNISGVYGLDAAIQYLDSLGHDYLEEHDRRLSDLMLTEVSKLDGIRYLPGDVGVDRSAILSLSIPGSSVSNIARALSDSYGIMCRSGHLCCQPFVADHYGGEILRVSAYIYTSEDDVRYFFCALDGLRHRL